MTLKTNMGGQLEGREGKKEWKTGEEGWREENCIKIFSFEFESKLDKPAYNHLSNTTVNTEALIGHGTSF